MGKAEEAVAKRKAKAVRKRLRSSSSMPASLRAHIAAKKRRKDGKRRLCQGMCFTLPTPEDPFNDRCVKKRKRNGEKECKEFEPELPSEGDMQESSSEQEEEEGKDEQDERGQLLDVIRRSPDGALTAYQLLAEAAVLEKKVKKADRFSRELWKACCSGSDIIGMVNDVVNPVHAYLPAIVNHLANQRASGCLALVLVPSQEGALLVRRICKPLKHRLGLHAVSIHDGTQIEHQVEGLRLSMPDVLISTPERLCELHKRGAVDISSVSLMVIDALDTIIDSRLSSSVLRIKALARRAAQFVMLSSRFHTEAIEITRQVVKEPVIRVVASREDISHKSACIAQEVSVFTDSNQRLPKLLRILKQAWKTQAGIVILVDNSSICNGEHIVKAIRDEGYKAELLVDVKKARGLQQANGALVTMEQMLEKMDLDKVTVVLNYSFPSTMDVYLRLLGSIARNSCHGIVHSFIVSSDAPLSGHLSSVLEQCGQPVPRALELLAKAAAAVVNKNTNLVD